jgi:hypothetical protein
VGTTKRSHCAYCGKRLKIVKGDWAIPGLKWNRFAVCRSCGREQPQYQTFGEQLKAATSPLRASSRTKENTHARNRAEEWDRKNAALIEKQLIKERTAARGSHNPHSHNRRAAQLEARLKAIGYPVPQDTDTALASGARPETMRKLNSRSADDPTDEKLRELEGLHEEGVLSEAEYEAARARLVGAGNVQTPNPPSVDVPAPPVPPTPPIPPPPASGGRRRV